MSRDKKLNEIIQYIDFLEEVFGDIAFTIDEKIEKRKEESKREDKAEKKFGEKKEKGEEKKKEEEGKREEEDKKKKSIFDSIVKECYSLPEPWVAIKEEKTHLLRDIADRIRACKRCPLWEKRKNAVPGDGNPSAEIVFVGEAPGYEEDKKGKPFVGKSGKLLETLIKEEIGLDRSSVFITNVVRCRPPENRMPEKKEIEACSPYLFEEINAIKPKIVVALGSPAAKVLIGRDEKISEMRGNFYKRPEFEVFVTFHPAYAIRNPSQIEVMREDFKKIKEFLRSE